MSLSHINEACPISMSHVPNQQEVVELRKQKTGDALQLTSKDDTLEALRVEVDILKRQFYRHFT